MKKLTVVFALLVVTIAMVGKVKAEEASQTYVSLSGDNGMMTNQPGQQPPNDCKKRKSPCKTITYALEQTKDGGTITLLEGGEKDDEAICNNHYDSVTIIKSVTIEADRTLKTKPCFLSTYQTENTKGFGINTNRDDKGKFTVKLHGLRFVGVGGYEGVTFLSGSKLIVEDCYFKGLNHGIVFDAEGSLTVTNSKSNATTGIWLQPSMKIKKAIIRNCTFFGNSLSAVEVNSNGSAIVEKSKLSGVNITFLVKGTGSLVVKNSTIFDVP